MRLRRRRDPAPTSIVATKAEPPTYATTDDFIAHALRYPMNGWYEPLFGAVEGVGTVSRCLQLNSQQIATMPLRYRHSANTQGREPLWVHDPDPAWYPNGIGDAIFAAVWSIYARGDAFLWVTSRYEDGYPRSWTVLDPNTMRVGDGGGSRSYASNRVPLNSRDVLQITRNPNGALRGTSALEAYAPNVASAYEADAFASDVYRSSGVNRVALKSKRPLNAEQAADVQGQWAAAVSKRLGAPAIIPPDLDLIESLSISPKDLMLLESREWDARQLAAAFGVPAMLLNIAISGGMVYQNPAMLADLWWRTELMPCAVKVERALSRWLPRGSWVEFDPTRMLRPDLATQNDVALAAVAGGLLTQDEARAWVYDLPPIGFGDQATELYEPGGASGSVETISDLGEVVLP